MALTIDLRSSNLPISVALREHVTRRLHFAVGRFGHRLERIVVRVVDVNGPKGGPDKRCRILARLSPAESAERVVVEATDSDAYAAVSQAAIRLDERVARALTKKGARRLAERRVGPPSRPSASRARAGDPKDPGDKVPT